MNSMFKNIVKDNNSLSSIIDAEIISSSKTRLGGKIFHLLTKSKQEVFMKVGIGQERTEIIREYNNLSLLQNHLPVPKIYDYTVTDSQAIIILTKMPGLPLHMVIHSLERQTVFLIITDILKAIYQIPDYLKKNFEVAAFQELEDIKNLIDSNKINKDIFKSKNLSLEQAYNIVKQDLENHNTQNLSHGDLCLPNIILTRAGEWSLIDWGKSGLGDKCRDLYSLEFSLKKNINNQAFLDHQPLAELCKIMNLEITPYIRQKMDLYKIIDCFWHNVSL